MNRGLIQFLIVGALVIALITGCAILISRGGGEGERIEGGGSQAMTFDQFQSIDLNSNQGDIEAEYGSPLPQAELEEAQITPTPGCTYYRAEDPQFGQFFEFCYENGILTNKSTL